MPRALLVLAGVLAVAACGRYGFEDQTSEHVDAARLRDGALVIDAAHPTIDGAPGLIDAPTGACGYISCPMGQVTCCAEGGAPAECINAGATCAGLRYECTQGPPDQMGCVGVGEDCCLSCDMTGQTECLDPATEMCCG
jgi:hypothetical protein